MISGQALMTTATVSIETGQMRSEFFAASMVLSAILKKEQLIRIVPAFLYIFN